MNCNELSDDQRDLLFDVQRSIRYHDRRLAFFDRLHRVTLVLTVLLAGYVLVEASTTAPTPAWVVMLSVVAAIMALIDVVTNYSAKAELHRLLKTRFIQLEMEIVAVGTQKSDWAHYQAKRLSIECDEPPVYRALDLLCHNELAASQGRDDIYALTCIQRATSQLIHWPNIGSESQPISPK